MSNIHNDEWKEDQYQRRDEWLVGQHRVWKDVIEDEKGEFIMVEKELMDEGEPESGGYRKVYLPDDLQKDYLPE